jgi:MFS family permease
VSRRLTRDGAALSLTAVLFTTSLGVSSVAFPLLALRAGRSASEVGVLVAASALVQILARSRLGTVMRRVPDRAVLACGPVGLAASFVVLLVSASLVALALAWAVLALGRACFWTAGQTHAVRGEGSSVKRLASLNFFGSTGALIGPVIAGLLVDTNMTAALASGVVLAVAALLPATFLDRFAPFGRVAEQLNARAMWRRPGVDAGCWAGVTAGAWRGLMDSFVPVALERARHSSATIGLLVSVANAAAVVASVLVRKLSPGSMRRIYVTSMLAAALGLAWFGPASESALLAAAALAVSGLGAGVLQTLGPATAASSVDADEKGDAMAAYGAMRTAAMFAAPLVTSGALVVASLPTALTGMGCLLALPVVAAHSLSGAGARPSDRRSESDGDNAP